MSSSDASLWRRMWSRSAALANVFTGTSTRADAADGVGRGDPLGRFAIQTATRAPLTTPAPISARASARDLALELAVGDAPLARDDRARGP